MPADLTSDLPAITYDPHSTRTIVSHEMLQQQEATQTEATSSSPFAALNTCTTQQHTINNHTTSQTTQSSITPTISVDCTPPTTSVIHVLESAARIRTGLDSSAGTASLPSTATPSLAPSPSTATSSASTASLAQSTAQSLVAGVECDVSSSHSSVSDEAAAGEDEEDAARRIRTPHGPELLGLSKLPFQMIQVPLPWQHAVSRNECKLLSVEQKNLMVQRPVRVMLCSTPPCGPDANGRLVLTPSNIWFVAKDVAQLLHIHEANVARRIAPFLPHERARMPVQCMQSNGTKATLMLSVLSVAGMTRLLTASKKAVMGVRLHTFLTSYVNQLCLSPPLYSTVTQQTLTLMQSPSATTLTLHPSALSHTNPSPALAAHLMQYQMNPTGLIPLPMPAVTAAAAAAVAAANAASNAAAYQQAAAYRASMGVNMMMPPPPPPPTVTNDPYAVYHVKNEIDQILHPNSKKQYLPYHLAASHSAAAAASQQYVQMQHMPPPPPSYQNNHGGYGASYYNSVSHSAGPYPSGNWNSAQYNSNGYPAYGAPYSYPPTTTATANGNGGGSVPVNSSSYPIPMQPPNSYQYHSNATAPMQHSTSIFTPVVDAQPLRSDLVKSEQCSSPSNSASPPVMMHPSSVPQLQLADGGSDLSGGGAGHSHRAHLKRPHS